MTIALVHDYLNEFGGAERALEALSDLYPEAPIFTAFYKKGSPAYERFKHKKIIQSWAHSIPFFAQKLHSPLRFLAPQIWQSFDFSGFDVVISSSSWYITKGIHVPRTTHHISYIHTPPRYLYGYQTASEWQKNPLIKLYALLVNKGLREFDYYSAQKVDVLVANSKEVQQRIKKFWRRDSLVIYPPVEITHSHTVAQSHSRPYLLTGGRLVGPKHFDLAIKAANQLKLPLKIFGTGPEENHLRSLAGPTVEFLGKVSETHLSSLYSGTEAFLALADDEDFGITPVEAMMAGTPVIAYRGGGYQESVAEGKTGLFIDSLTVQDLTHAINQLQASSFKLQALQSHVQKFSKARFQKEISELVQRTLSSGR